MEMNRTMKRLIMIPLLMLTFLSMAAYSTPNEEPLAPEQPGITLPDDNDQNNNNEEITTSMKMNIIIGARTITATMEDNAAAKDLISRLPLEVTLNDFNNTTEKIFYPEPALTLEGVKRGCAPVPGDITIYAPWGNVAIFCKNWSHSNDLIKIGHIDGDGISALTVGGDIKVKFEKQ